MLEKDLVRKIIGSLREQWPDSFWIKIPGGPTLAGIPDIIGCVNGIFVALEVKRPDTSYTVTPRQKANIVLVLGAGGIAAVVTSVEKAIGVVSAGLAGR